MKTALVLIDFQQTFRDGSWGTSSSDQAEVQAAKLLKHFRQNQLPIFHIHHWSQHPDSRFYFKSNGFSAIDMVKPLEDELVLTKTVNSAFIGTSLEAILREQSVSCLIIAGLTTPHCVSTTIRMATNLGFSVTLAEDATASFPLHDHNGRIFSAQEIQDSTLASLNEVRDRQGFPANGGLDVSRQKMTKIYSTPFLRLVISHSPSFPEYAILV